MQNINTNSNDPWFAAGPARKYSSDSQMETESEKKGFRKMYIAAASALIFGVAMGMASAYSATATENMKRASSSVIPDADEITWIGSLLALGALIGGVVSGYLSNKFGRKGALILSSVPFLAGWLCIAYAQSVTLIFVGRILTGFCCGLVCVTTPAYLVEISTPEVRGFLGACFQLFVVIGVLLVTSLGSILTWKWLSIAGAVTSIVALCVMCIMPESPRWLVANGQYQEAIRAVKFLQGNHLDASAECVSINEDLCLQPKGKFTLEEFLKPGVYKPAILSVGLVFFQQACGSNAVLFYTVAIFKDAGSSLKPVLATIIVDVVLVLATALSSVLMDKAGRKVLLIISGIGMAVSLAVLGGYDIAGATFHKTHGWIPLASLVTYIAAFSLGFGPIPWLMMAEITPVRVRSIIGGGATACCWGFVFIVTKTFQDLEHSLNDYGAYWLFAGFCVLGCVFTAFCLPETKGKPFEEIQEYFSNSNAIIPSETR